MNDVMDMMRNHSAPADVDLEALTACIAACFACEQACTACADACLAEEKVAELRHCIRPNPVKPLRYAASGGTTIPCRYAPVPLSFGNLTI